MGAERIAQLRRELTQSERQIVEGVTNIAKQLKLIAEMERLGHDRAAAESLLALFEEIQRMHQQHRQAIIRELDELDPPLTPQRTGGRERLKQEAPLLTALHRLKPSRHPNCADDASPIRLHRTMPAVGGPQAALEPRLNSALN